VGLDSSHDFAIRHIDPYETVLDIGGSSGHVARALRQNKGCYVFGVDAHMHPSTEDNYDHFIQADLDRDSITSVFPHERAISKVLLLDVIEHLSEPEKFMTELRQQTAAQRCKIVITTGNVGFILTRLSLLFGNFNYGKRGILDFTHKRLFTFGSLKQLLNHYGYTIEKIQGIPVPIQLIVKNPRLANFLLMLNRAAMKINRRLFSYQIAVIATPLPTLDLLLQQAESTAVGQPTAL
jgi:hypothetical protein